MQMKIDQDCLHATHFMSMVKEKSKINMQTHSLHAAYTRTGAHTARTFTEVKQKTH